MFQGRLRSDSRVSKRTSRGVKREFEGSFKVVLRKFQRKCVSRKLEKKLQGRFKNVSMKFCSCMDLIAATRAEGGLVF